MFERFTDRARRALAEAQDEAAEFGYGFIGTEHVLLGLLREGDGLAYRLLDKRGITLESARDKAWAATAPLVAGNLLTDEAEALAAIGIDLDRVKASVEATFGPGSLTRDPARPPFSPASKNALEVSLREALAMRHAFIGTEHLLIGFVAEPEGIARVVLEDLGVDVDEFLDASRRAAAPEQARVGDLYAATRDFEGEHLPDADDATRGVLQTLSEGRVAAMRREHNAVISAAKALGDELEARLREAEAALSANS